MVNDWEPLTKHIKLEDILMAILLGLPSRYLKRKDLCQTWTFRDLIENGHFSNGAHSA